MAASMMGDQLKEDNGSVTLRIKGDGPLGEGDQILLRPGRVQEPFRA